jgi:hypothetical protein
MPGDKTDRQGRQRVKLLKNQRVSEKTFETREFRIGCLALPGLSIFFREELAWPIYSRI